MVTVNLVQTEEEILFVADGESWPLRQILVDLCVPDDVNKIISAVAGSPGVGLAEFVGLLVNAGVEKARHACAAQLTRLSCNIQPGCNSELGHEGECDMEVPF